MLSGVVGAVLAAPLTSAGVSAFGLLRREGLLGDAPPAAAAERPDGGGLPPDRSSPEGNRKNRLPPEVVGTP